MNECDVEGVDTRLTILWFTEGGSLDAWDEFAGAGDLVTATGLGRVELMAPFTPTLPGTDRCYRQAAPPVSCSTTHARTASRR